MRAVYLLSDGCDASFVGLRSRGDVVRWLVVLRRMRNGQMQPLPTGEGRDLLADCLVVHAIQANHVSARALRLCNPQRRHAQRLQGSERPKSQGTRHRHRDGERGVTFCGWARGLLHTMVVDPTSPLRPSGPGAISVVHSRGRSVLLRGTLSCCSPDAMEKAA
jgi:hypothetical protein